MFPFPPSRPGLTSRSSTDTSSFSTASMAAAPAILTPRSLLCHRLHGLLAELESHFRRPEEAGPLPIAEPITLRSWRRARPSPPVAPRPFLPRRQRTRWGTNAHARNGPPFTTQRADRSWYDSKSHVSPRECPACAFLHRGCLNRVWTYVLVVSPWTEKQQKENGGGPGMI